MATEITKLYITSRADLTEQRINYLIMSNKCYPRRIVKINRWNAIVTVEYTEDASLQEIIKTKEIRGLHIAVKRIFKSIKIPKKLKGKHPKSFTYEVIMGISGLIKKKVNIRVINNRASEYQKYFLTEWQKELDNPNLFKKAGIKPSIDISPDGELLFRIVKSGEYIITSFEENIDKYL